MPDIQSSALPLIPLANGVVFPSTVLTVAVESPEANAALEALEHQDEKLVFLVPKVGDRYSRVGTVARVEDVGTLRNGTTAVVVRGLHRATVGIGVSGAGSALWVQQEPATESEASPRATELATELRAISEAVLEARHLDAIGLLDVESPSQLADTVGYWPDATQGLKVEVLETLNVEARLELVITFARRVLGEIEIRDRIRNDVAEGMEKTQRDFMLRQQLAAIKKELG